jgi:putative lipoic acid-binding regulatory protein
MILDSNSERPELKYPCEWIYKVIGKDVDKLIAAIETASLELDYEVTPSNVSENENYFSLNFKITVPSEAARDIIYQKLNNHKDVIMVL